MGLLRWLKARDPVLNARARIARLEATCEWMERVLNRHINAVHDLDQRTGRFETCLPRETVTYWTRDPDCSFDLGLGENVPIIEFHAKPGGPPDRYEFVLEPDFPHYWEARAEFDRYAVEEDWFHRDESIASIPDRLLILEERIKRLETQQ